MLSSEFIIDIYRYIKIGWILSLRGNIPLVLYILERIIFLSKCQIHYEFGSKSFFLCFKRSSLICRHFWYVASGLVRWGESQLTNLCWVDMVFDLRFKNYFTRYVKPAGQPAALNLIKVFWNVENIIFSKIFFRITTTTIIQERKIIETLF